MAVMLKDRAWDIHRCCSSCVNTKSEFGVNGTDRRRRVVRRRENRAWRREVERDEA